MRKTKLVITEPFEKLKQENITFSWNTIMRLLKLGSDVYALYSHYCLTARLQAKIIGKYTNTIKATSSYEMKGLNLTKARFHTAKNLLLTNGFVEDVDPRNNKGQFKAHYIKIHYLRKNVVLETDSIEENQSPINPEDGESTQRENQRMENPDTNTKDKNGNAIDKKINAGNENEKNNSNTFFEESSLGAKENKQTQEEQQAQEIIDAIKAECGLDLKDKQKWKEQVKQITKVQKELHREAKDFVNCVKFLSKNPYYKVIHLNTVLKTIRIMSPQTLEAQSKEDEEKIGYTLEEALTSIFEQNAKEYGTTVEFERAKDELEQKWMHSFTDLGRDMPTFEERMKHNEDVRNLKRKMLGTT